ncbi:MAG TPA: NAD-dependent epimerase/dehydratase family protein [Flavipsychrobacter sp.]|nr:NAD-dependent epimerase/dehydratase family protein [Flavipsychrobacter sp.]
MILVTGASGFLGQHLVELLSRQGKKVRALYNRNQPSESLQQLPHISWQQCDLLDVYDVEEAMQGIAKVYHCAAVVSFHPREKEKMLHFNLESTANIVNEALLQNIQKLVFVSSIAALGRSEEGNKEITEEEQWEESKYNSRYGLSKHLAELEIWRAAGEGLNVVIVNPGIILGEGNWNEGSARLMKVVNNEFPFYTEGINAWVDVKDVVNIMTLLMESNIQNERFILSAGNFSYKEVFTEMANALGKKPPHIKAGKLLTSLVWRWSMIKSNLFGETATITKETASTAQKKAFYNNGKLSEFLPHFQYASLQTTIRRMAKRFTDENNAIP